MKAILFDATRCVGCRKCEKACDVQNEKDKRKWSKEKDGDFRPPPKGLSGEKWLHLSFHKRPDKKDHGKFDWADVPGEVDEDKYMYTRHACMHCLDPACVNACIVGALQKTKEGPVIYDKDMCIGCRYCMLACPFHIPKWEWHKALPYIRKCTMCYERQQKGEEPKCVGACDYGAIEFGDRDDLLYEAQGRIREDKEENKDKPNYYPHVFGKDEVGGTSVLYLTRLHAGKVGLPGNLGKRSIPNFAASPMSTVPYWIGGLGAMLAGTYWIIDRRNKVPAEERAQEEGGAK
jgi:formate dehydrogenase iron-sulfur subunit